MKLEEGDIRHAYRLLLGREPDPGGMDHYRKLLIDDQITSDQLREEMTNSREFQQRQGDLLHTAQMGDIKVVVNPEEPEFGRTIAQHGMWEPHIVQCIAEHLSAGDTYVDIGANVGIMSFHAAKAVGPAGRVIAFEPDKDNIQNLLRGILLNELENILLYPFAASDSRAVFSLQGSSNAYLSEAGGVGRLVQSFPADELLAREERIDFIKLDIEGHEPQALAGLADTLRRHRPTVLCEFNPRCLRDHIGKDVAEFASDLFALTDHVEIVEDVGPRTPVAGAAELLELWTVRNRTLAESGALPDGLLHFDLLFEASRAC